MSIQLLLGLTGDMSTVEAASTEEARDWRDWRSDIACSSRPSLRSGEASVLLLNEAISTIGEGMNALSPCSMTEHSKSVSEI